jgi:hypothetical protein
MQQVRRMLIVSGMLELWAIDLPLVLIGDRYWGVFLSFRGDGAS